MVQWWGNRKCGQMVSVLDSGFSGPGSFNLARDITFLSWARLDCSQHSVFSNFNPINAITEGET